MSYFLFGEPFIMNFSCLSCKLLVAGRFTVADSLGRRLFFASGTGELLASDSSHFDEGCDFLVWFYYTCPRYHQSIASALPKFWGNFISFAILAKGQLIILRSLEIMLKVHMV